MRRMIIGCLGMAGCASAADVSLQVPDPSTAIASTKLEMVEPLGTTEPGMTPLMPRGITSFGAASIDGQIYFVGGYFGGVHSYSKSEQNGDFVRFDPESGQWEKIGAILPAQSVALVSNGTHLFRVGGMEAHNEAGADADLHSVSTVERFDPKTRTWTTLPSLPEARSSHDAVIVGDALFVVGGWKLEGDMKKASWHENILRLDLQHPEQGWEPIDAPMQRRGLAAAPLGEKFVVIGGLTPGREVTQKVEIYDPSTKHWSLGPDFPGPAFGVSAAAIDGRVYASGSDGMVYTWADGEEQWTVRSELVYPRFFHRLVADDEQKLWVLGGIQPKEEGYRVRAVESVSVDTPRSVDVLRFSMDSPLDTKNRQGLALINEDLFIFGGNRSLGQHDFEPQFFSDDGARLNLAEMTWSDVAPYPTPRQTMATAVTPWGHVLAVGGFGHDGEVARTHPELYAYNPRSDQWRPAGVMPGLGRSQFGLAATEDSVWIFGGLDYDPRRPEAEQFRHETAVLGAKLETGELTFEPTGVDLPSPRRAFAGVIDGGHYYLVGGMQDGFELVTTCDVFTFEDRTWSSMACPSKPRLSGDMVALDGQLYLAGGSSRPSPDSKLQPNRKLEVYDPQTDEWSVLIDELPIEPKHLRMLAYHGRLLLFSTHNDSGQVNALVIRPPSRLPERE